MTEPNEQSASNGVHNVARQLVREQQAAGHRSELILLAYGPLAPLEQGEARSIHVKARSVGGRQVWLHRSVIDQVLQDAGGDTIFHIHGGRQPMLVGLAAAMYARGIPYVVTVHGRFSHLYDRAGGCLKRSTAAYLRIFERGMLNRARFVQALSRPEAKVLRRIAPRSTIEIVGNGAYSSKLQTAPPPLSTKSELADCPRFVFCGRYAVHHKGLDLLLGGFARYRRAGGRGHLTTIGTGPARTELQKLANDVGIADAVDIRGPLFTHERDAALAECDYFIMASRYEGIPLAALEAASSGLPLVMTEETGLADAVRAHGAGIVIEALSEEAVCKALQRASIQSAGLWQHQRVAARELARSIGDWSDISSRLCALYRSSDKRQSNDYDITS